jgi:hypothetical protein
MSRVHRMRRLMGFVMGLSIGLTAAVGQERGAGNPGGPAGCPTRFDYEVLASAADSGNLLSLSAYRFRRDTSYSSVPITGLQRVVFRSTFAASDCGLPRETILQQRD